jgi:hypothetical protein
MLYSTSLPYDAIMNTDDKEKQIQKKKKKKINWISSEIRETKIKLKRQGEKPEYIGDILKIVDWASNQPS